MQGSPRRIKLLMKKERGDTSGIGRPQERRLKFHGLEPLSGH